MALTDDCDLFGSIHEDGVNLVARHVMRQRPSLFNYGTAQIAANKQLWCRQVEVVPDVLNFNDPIMTVVPPLPLADTGYGVNYSFQITKAEIDFHPGNVVTLPSQLSPPLNAQHFAAHAEVCGGIGCPPKEIVDRLPPARPRPGNHDRPQEPVTPLPTRKLDCFCLEVFIVGHVEVVAILPQLRVALSKLVFDLLGLGTVTLAPTVTSAAVPNNPAIENDELKVFVDMTVSA